MNTTQYALWHQTLGIVAATLADDEYKSWIRFWNGEEYGCDFQEFRKRREGEGWRSRKVKLALVEDPGDPSPYDRIVEALGVVKI